MRNGESLAVPEVRFEEETSDEKKEVSVKKMHIDYSGAIPQVTYTEE